MNARVYVVVSGVVFLLVGLLHRIDELLAHKMRVTHLIHSLPFAADPWLRLQRGGGHDG
ncbi:MAG: hypothetical protein HY744_12820 [Deltaproteobacteria bacterium]|nr:hypothetical protein [Deltaproteobacteria bacterium]